MRHGAIDNGFLSGDMLKRVNVELVSVSELKPHEEIDENRLSEVLESITREGLKYPVVVDRRTNIIIDGHHRFNTFKKLNVDKIPVFYVDYFDARIVLDSWRGLKLTKNDVIEKVDSGKLFLHKTTKHVFLSDNGPVHISVILPEVNLKVVTSGDVMRKKCAESLVSENISNLDMLRHR